MIKLFFSSVILFIFIIFICPVQAAEISAGLSTWYMKWIFNGNDDLKIPPAFMYGPAAAIRFTDNWTVACLFLYGKFDPEIINSKFTRYDSDISLNYNINKYFKIFMGGKFLAFTWQGNDKTKKHWSTGPGLGAGTALPVPAVNNLFFIMNISGIFAKGHHDNTNSPGSQITERGFNSTAALAYYIEPASTSVNLGFRYQYIYIDYQESRNANGDNSDSGNYFYGATLTIIYKF